MPADVLVTLGARASTGMVLTLLSQNIPSPASEELIPRCCICLISWQAFWFQLVPSKQLHLLISRWFCTLIIGLNILSQDDRNRLRFFNFINFSNNIWIYEKNFYKTSCHPVLSVHIIKPSYIGAGSVSRTSSYIDGLVQDRRNSSALELHLPCINPSTWWSHTMKMLSSFWPSVRRIHQWPMDLHTKGH